MDTHFATAFCKKVGTDRSKAGHKKLKTMPLSAPTSGVALRQWQPQAFEALKDSPHTLLCAPMGSGKSVLIEFLCAHRLKANPTLRCVISVPQDVIAPNFTKNARLVMPDGDTVRWFAQH